ncbi:MAG: hypothetical protein JXD22_02030 [Sedimentisphaerales bacterium]|nr:hypothetical protein [Sedimentisphaerales bacterium]
MPAARSSSEPKKSLLITMIVFIALFLLAATAAVIMYMDREKLTGDKNSAEDKLAELANNAQISAIKPLAGTVDGRKITAVGKLTEDMQYLSGLIMGSDMAESELPGLKERVDNNLLDIWQTLAEMPQPELADSKQAHGLGLAGITKALLDENLRLNEELLRVITQLDESIAQIDKNKADYQNELDQLNTQLNDAVQSAEKTIAQYESLRDESRDTFDGIIKDLETQIASAQGLQKQTSDENTKLKTQIEEYQTAVAQLNERLQQLQPKPDTEIAALEPDGYVISVEERDKIAYINLAENDHIYRGLTFSVYDRFQNIPKTGKPKGSLEVIEIMATISKCRITDFDQTNPIMANDVIANLIWSQDKKYLFCVAGDFDFNGDGLPDSDGYERVTKLIEHWGGRVSSTMSVDTDFLVLGSPSKKPIRPSDEYESSDEALQKFQQAEKRALEYQEVCKDGAALDVPTFNLSRFLYFIGYYKQATLAGS